MHLLTTTGVLDVMIHISFSRCVSRSCVLAPILDNQNVEQYKFGSIELQRSELGIITIGRGLAEFTIIDDPNDGVNIMHVL